MRERRFFSKVFILILMGFLCVSNGYSQHRRGSAVPEQAAVSEQTVPQVPLTPEAEAKIAGLSTTSHSIILNGKPLNYKATAGYMVMKDELNRHKANMFYISYTKEGSGDLTTRPVTFVFNGGPGSASLWLHMGCMGPKRVKLSDEGFQLPQPYRYVDNEFTWLEFTDLVFIDPVSTGYSRPATGVEKKEFHGLVEDVMSVGEFIRLYVTRNNRWQSPKYLCGESYGTTRAAGLSGYLQDTYGMNLQGIVLISSILNFQTARPVSGNDLPYVLFLPTYTATAWYYKKLPPEYMGNLETTLKEVEKWALGDYMVALAKGSALTVEERNDVVKKLSGYTGLSKEYIEKMDLRIPPYSFRDELFSVEKQMVGRLDTRFKTYKGNLQSDEFNDDPSYDAIYGPYSSVINHYLRNELKYTNDLHYWAISEQLAPWNWGGEGMGYANVADVLQKAMVKNRFLKVLIANGYYDLATPYFATIYTVNHLGLPPELAKNLEMKYFESGHMIYINQSCLKQLRDDVFELYKKTRE